MQRLTIGATEEKIVEASNNKASVRLRRSPKKPYDYIIICYYYHLVNIPKSIFLFVENLYCIILVSVSFQ